MKKLERVEYFDGNQMITRPPNNEEIVAKINEIVALINATIPK